MDLYLSKTEPGSRTLLQIKCGMKKHILKVSALCIPVLAGCRKSSDIGIIGGADGPTAILVSTSSDSGMWLAAVLAVVLIAVVILKQIKKD